MEVRDRTSNLTKKHELISIYTFEPWWFRRYTFLYFVFRDFLFYVFPLITRHWKWLPALWPESSDGLCIWFLSTYSSKPRFVVLKRIKYEHIKYLKLYIFSNPCVHVLKEYIYTQYICTKVYTYRVYYIWDGFKWKLIFHCERGDNREYGTCLIQSK